MKNKKQKHVKKVYQVPSNQELDVIKVNPVLSEIVKEDMITLHKINKGLKSMVMDSVKSCTEELKDSSDNWIIVRIDVYTPHVQHPGDIEYITNEVQSMIDDWWDTALDVEVAKTSQAFIICMTLEYAESGDPFGHYVTINAIPLDINNPAWVRSTLSRVI